MGEDLAALMSDSYLIHLWGSTVKQGEAEVRMRADLPYYQICLRQCPNVEERMLRPMLGGSDRLKFETIDGLGRLKYRGSTKF